MPTIMQWKGRKLAFITSSTFVLIGWIVIYFANSVSTILISESLQGFGANGLLTVSYLCLSEMVTPENRNVFIQSYNICQCIGLSLIAITIKTLHWRLVGLVFSVPLVVAIVISFMWPESPFWLAWKGKTEECEKNFIWLRGNGEESIKELNELIAAQKENRQRKQNTNMIKKIYSDITTKSCYIPGLHILLLFSLTYFSGGMVIILYSVELIQRTARDENIAFMGAISINFLLLFGATTNGVLVKRFKNKTVLLASAFGSTIILLLASTFTYLQTIEVLGKESKLCLYCLIGFAITGMLGMLPITITISAELMPVRYRGIGGCISMLCTCILLALTLKTAPYLFLYIGLHGTFLLYSCNIIILASLVWKFIPETKNRTLQEIENFYTYGKFENRFMKSENEQTHMIKL